MVGRACPQRAESDVFQARGSPGRTRPTGELFQVGQAFQPAFQPAGRGDFRVPSLADPETELESSVNPQARKPALRRDAIEMPVWP